MRALFTRFQKLVMVCTLLRNDFCALLDKTREPDREWREWRERVERESGD